MGQLAVIEAQFKPLVPRMEAAIPPTANLPVKRIMESFLIACEREPALMDCTPVSLQRAVFSACTLGTPVDGATGQGYIVRYKSEAQYQIGFKGYGTLAARSGYILGGDVIYEGEKFDIRLGTGGHVHVQFDPTKRRPGAKIVAAYGTLESNSAPPLIIAMSLDEIMAVRAISKARYDNAPWNVHFEQMAIKTAKKRAGKSCPVDILHLAAALDDATDQGKRAYIRPEDSALIVDAEVSDVSGFQPPPAEDFTLDRQEGPSMFVLIAKDRSQVDMKNPENWSRNLDKVIAGMETSAQAEAFQDRHRETLRKMEVRFPDLVTDARLRVNNRLHELKGAGK